MSSKGKVAIFVVLAVAVIAFLRVHRKPHAGKMAASAPIAVTETKVKGKGVAKPKAAKSDNLRQRIQDEAALGFLNVPVSKSGDKVGVNVQLAVKEQCEPGDVDVMEMEAKTAEKPRLLMTVEPIDGGDPVYSRRVTVEDIKNGVTEKIAVPNSSDPRPLGIYICLDSKNEGHCGGKATADMVTEYSKNSNAVPAKGKGQSRAKDKIFFFEYLHVQQGTMQVLGHTAPKDSQYKAIAAHYENGIDSRTKAEDIVETVKKTNNQITSMAPEVNAKGLRLVLPYGNKASCKNQVLPGKPKMDVVMEGHVKGPDTPPTGTPRAWEAPEADRKPPPPPPPR